jgi:hypothetical protein
MAGRILDPADGQAAELGQGVWGEASAIRAAGREAAAMRQQAINEAVAIREAARAEAAEMRAAILAVSDELGRAVAYVTDNPAGPGQLRPAPAGRSAAARPAPATRPLFVLYIVGFIFIINEEIFTGSQAITMHPPAN